jgi:FdhD protein
VESDEGAVARRAAVRIGATEARPGEDEVAVEAPLEIRVGGRPLTVIMRTPGADEELVRGFLFSEGVIGGAGDLLSLGRPDGLRGEEEGNVIAVELAPPPIGIGKGAAGGMRRPVGERSFYASASCGVCGKTSLADLVVRAAPVRSTLRVPAALLASLPERLRAAQVVFARTGGLHGSGLFEASGALLAVREDVGRHNAVDKLIGWALGAGRLPLSDAILMVSGRTSYEIVQKAVVAGVPVVAAVSAPSSLAIDLAARHGVTLVGFLRGATMNVYAHAERVG